MHNRIKKKKKTISLRQIDKIQYEKNIKKVKISFNWGDQAIHNNKNIREK